MTHQTKVTRPAERRIEPIRPAETDRDAAGSGPNRKQGVATEVFSPGRLCLFGEHSDWASEYGMHPGYCIVVGTDQSLRAVAEPSDVFCVESVVPDDSGRPSGRTRRMSCPWEAKALETAAQDQGEFFRYCAGVACEMLRRGYEMGGLDLRIVKMELPLKKGVSSSAAVCILVAKAFNECYGLHLLPHELMDISYHGERATGSQCGRMDQACIYGSVPVLLAFGPGGQVRIEPIFARSTLHLFYVDLAGKKDTVVILRDLHTQYPKDDALRQALGSVNEQIVRRAFSSVQNGRASDVGLLMTEAQAVFDRCVSIHCPEHLSAPLLHQVLALPEIQANIYGGKGVGSQGDGTAQFVARSESDRDEAMQKIVRAFPQMRCFPLTIRGQTA